MDPSAFLEVEFEDEVEEQVAGMGDLTEDDIILKKPTNVFQSEMIRREKNLDQMGLELTRLRENRDQFESRMEQQKKDLIYYLNLKRI